jgi:hypothetical protein
VQRGCDLLILIFKDQKIAAFGSSYMPVVVQAHFKPFGAA